MKTLWLIRASLLSALALSAGCLHAASATIPVLGLGSNMADRVTSQIAVSAVTTRGSSATDGAVLNGGYGGRLRFTRKGPFSPFARRGDSREEKSPLLFSSRIEAGSWGEDRKYFTSGSTIGLAVGSGAWTFGFTGGGEYGGYRTSNWLVPVKLHFLYVGKIQFNVEAWAGKRYGEFADQTKSISGVSVANAYGGSASLGWGTSRNFGKNRTGLGLGVFMERMDGVTVTGASLMFNVANADARASFGHDEDDERYERQLARNKEDAIKEGIERDTCRGTAAAAVDRMAPYADWSRNTGIPERQPSADAANEIKQSIASICESENWPLYFRRQIATNSNRLSSSSAVGPVLDQLEALAERAGNADRARIRKLDAAEAAANERADKERQREQAAVKAHVETPEERKREAERQTELAAALEHRAALVRESQDYAHHDIHRGMEIVGQLEVIEAYIACLQYESPAGQPPRNCYRPASLTVIKW
jgi:hypothetical protein